MHRIQGNCHDMRSPWRGQNSKPTSQEEQVSNTRLKQISSSKDMVLNLTTQEGDEINISLAARSLSSYLDYQETRQDSDGSHAGRLQMSSNESQLDYTMTVEGELSNKERADIIRALNTIDKMMSHFVQGRIEPMMANANRLSQLGTISDFSLEMSYSRDVLTVQQTEVQPVSDPLGTIYDSQGQLTETRPANTPAQPELAHAENQLTADADALSDAMANKLAHMREYADRLHRPLRQIFDKHHKHAQKLNPCDATASALIDRIHKDLLTKMQSQ